MAKFEFVWFGSGVNAAHARSHICTGPVAERDVLSRVMYQTSPTGNAFWAEMIDLETFCGGKKTVKPQLFQSIVGSFTEKVSELPATLKALAEVENVKTICLLAGESLLDFTVSEIPGWHGAWVAVEDGYVLAAVKTPKSDAEVNQMLDRVKGQWLKKPCQSQLMFNAYWKILDTTPCRPLRMKS